MSDHDPLAEVISEEKLAEYFGVDAKGLRLVRDLPYVQLPRGGRAYLATDILAWMRKRRVAKGSYRADG